MEIHRRRNADYALAQSADSILGKSPIDSTELIHEDGTATLMVAGKEMNIKPGVKLLDEPQGSGLVAERGGDVIYNERAFLGKD